MEQQLKLKLHLFWRRKNVPFSKVKRLTLERCNAWKTMTRHKSFGRRFNAFWNQLYLSIIFMLNNNNNKSSRKRPSINKQKDMFTGLMLSGPELDLCWRKWQPGQRLPERKVASMIVWTPFIDYSSTRQTDNPTIYPSYTHFDKIYTNKEYFFQLEILLKIFLLLWQLFMYMCKHKYIYRNQLMCLYKEKVILKVCHAYYY